MTFMSEKINDLMAALSNAQKKIGPAFKNKSNPFHKSVYADLDSIWDACREPLSENGLAVSQLINQGEKGIVLTTILGHSSGQWLRSDMPVNYKSGDKVNESQAIGSALTYARRYALAAIAGVATSDVKPDEGFDEDDDGNESHKPGISPKSFPQPVPTRKVISKEQYEEMMACLKVCPEKLVRDIEERIKKAPHNAKDFTDIPEAIYDKLMKYIAEEMMKI